MQKRKVFIFFVLLLLAVQVFFVSPAAAQQPAADAQTVERLERMIKEQQQQLESMQRQLNQLKQSAAEAQNQAKDARSIAAEAKTQAQGFQPPPPQAVTSGQKRVKLAISGQVNRAINLIDDSKNTDLYFVDSDASNTRVRFVGTAKTTDDLTLGSRLEIAATSNESGDVSQNTEDSGDFFNVRWADVTLASKKYGKLWLGKGDTASNNTAEVDLSKVDVVAYASVADIAGGMLFRQSSGNHSLTNVKVSNAFQDQDGLSRQNRIRYDTPTFWGFSLRTRRVLVSKRLSQKSEVRWLVAANTVQPIPGETKIVRVNLLTGKSKPF